MTKTELPSYQELCQVLDNTDIKMNPSQAHGLVCGLLCGNPANTEAWHEFVAGDVKSPETHELLQMLYETSAQQLSDHLFGFDLILPSADDSLPVRAEALTLWCQGMLTGLKLTQVQITNLEPSDMSEAITDLIEIAKMNFETIDSNEEDEAAYEELIEYVRVAVVLIYQDLREAEVAATHKENASKHLH